MSSDELREIFTFRDACISDTHDSLLCTRCRHIASDGGGRPAHEVDLAQSDEDDDSDLEAAEAEEEAEEEEEEVVVEEVVDVEASGDGDGSSKSKKKKTTKPKEKEKEKKQKKKKKKKVKAEAPAAVSATGDPLTQLQRSAQVGNPSEDQIALWAHHAQKSSIIDDVLRDCDVDNNISFVFELRVPPMVVPADAADS